MPPSPCLYDRLAVRLLLCLSLLCGITPAHTQTAALTTLVGSRTIARITGQTPQHVLDGTAIKVEHYDSGKMLRLAFALKPPHPDEEAAFLEQVQNKQSPSFHHFLSAAEWNERFGPSIADEQQVVEWAKREGLTITHRYGNRLVVDVEAPAGSIETALRLTLNTYQEMNPDGTLSEAKYSNDRDPMLPSPVSEIVESVQGLNSFESVQPATQHGEQVARPDYVPGPVVAEAESVRTDAVAADAAAQGIQTPFGSTGPLTQATPVISTTAPTNFYQPITIYDAGAYDYQGLNALGHCCNPLGNPTNSPRESTIAIAAFGDFKFSDVKSYLAAFPYLAENIQKFYIDGTYVCNNTKSPDNNCVEVTLDTEWSLSTSNSFGSSASTSKLVVYEGANGNNSTVLDLYNQILDDNTTRVLSTSWGCVEGSGCSNSSMKARDNVLSALAGQGWSIVAASGDQGATADCSTISIQFPASDPNVLATGGTTLQVYTNTLAFVSEVAWTGSNGKNSCGTNQGGSTGGFSTYFGVPGFQSGMGFTARSVPDLSLNANVGQDVYVNGGWSGLGGTSIAAPEVAGFLAQENAYLLSVGSICGSGNNSACAPLGNPDYPLYAQGNHPNGGHNPFYDVTSGCNSNDVTVAKNLTAFCSKVGYDQVTGWGTANMMQLAWALNWETLPANGIPYVTFSGPALNTWSNSNRNVNFTVVDYAGDPGYKGTGIAGYTVGWDSIPADPYTQATPAATGVSNSFYSGPQFANSVTGCIGETAGSSCYSTVADGCHTVHVRGWNNEGLTTGDSTYGPVCIDRNPPVVQSTITGTLDNGWIHGNATLTITATDLISGVKTVYYALNNAACTPSALATCSVYKGPLTMSAQGTTKVYFFARDNAGNYSAQQIQTVDLDDVAPVTTVSYSGTAYGSGYRSPLIVTLHGTDASSGVQLTYVALDESYIFSSVYTGPITVTAPGTHTLYYHSIDVAQNVESQKTATFVVAPTSTTTLTATPNAVPTNQAVMLTATVTDNIAAGQPNHFPSGTVSFFSDGLSVGSALLNNLSVATLSVELPAGTHAVTATYNTGTVVLPSTSAPVTVSVYYPTTTTVSVAAATGTVGGTTTLTANVVDSADGGFLNPTGTVTFYNTTGGNRFALGTFNLTNGSVTATFNETIAGVNLITASYSSLGSLFGASSDTVGKTITVAAAPPLPAVNDQAIETGVASTLTVIFAYTGQLAPTGAVTIGVNGVAVPGTPLCVYKQTGPSPHANCSLAYLTTLAPGQYPLTYTVAPDRNYLQITGSATLTVTP